MHIKFSGVSGDIVKLKIKNVPDHGKSIYLNDTKIPSVLDYKVILDKGLPRAELTIAITELDDERLIEIVEQY